MNFCKANLSIVLPLSFSQHYIWFCSPLQQMISPSRLTPITSKLAFLKTDLVASTLLNISRLYTLKPEYSNSNPIASLTHYFPNKLISNLIYVNFYFYLFLAQL